MIYHSSHTVRKLQFGLLGFLLFVLVAGPLAAVVMKYFMGESSALSVAPVTGMVLHANGTPVAGAMVQLFGPGRKSLRPVGTSNAIGVFTLSTFAENDGAPPGDYAVVIADSNGKTVLSSTLTLRPGSNTLKFTLR